MNSSNELDLIQLDLPATYKYLNVLGACIGSILERETGRTDLDPIVYRVKLAAHEACTNIVEHAYAGTGGRINVVLSLAEQHSQFTVDLYDRGRSFSLPDIRQPNLDEVQTSGYGLFLMYRLMDQVDYEPQPGNNHWRLMIKL